MKASDQDSIASLNLCVRAENALRAEGIATITQLTALSEAQALKIPNIGRTAFGEIRHALSLCGRAFGDKPDDPIRALPDDPAELKRIIRKQAEVVRLALQILRAARPLVLNLERFRDIAALSETD